MTGEPFDIDRRVTIKWMLAAMAASAAPVQGAYAAPAPASPWPSQQPNQITAHGYGTDPNLTEPVVPWPKTLTSDQLATVAALCDTILPPEGRYLAPSKVGVQHFIDEWISAPYPQQAGDRTTLLNGFCWVEQEARKRYDKAYPQLDEAARALILMDAVRSGPAGSAFLARMKFLTTGGYYTSAEGIEELGYIGNVPITDSDYPGPTAEAIAHLKQVLASLNLKLS